MVILGDSGELRPESDEVGNYGIVEKEHHQDIV